MKKNASLSNHGLGICEVSATQRETVMMKKTSSALEHGQNNDAWLAMSW